MSTLNKNLSSKSARPVQDAKPYKFGIVWSEWNYDITHGLMEGAKNTLLKHGAREENITIRDVPGSFELVMGAQFMAEFTNVDAVICIGCVIQGETRHFDFICDAVANGIAQLNIKFNKPFIFGVLTPDTEKQAIDRAGGDLGNKGEEAAETAIKMVALRRSF